MQALFAPVIALMNRMGYGKKFAIMGALALAAIVVLLFGLYNSLDQVIRTSQRELAGIEAIKPMARLVQHLQQHRGMSAALINGNQAMKEKRAAKEVEVAAAIKAVEPKLLPVLLANDGWKKVLADWGNISKDGLGWTSTESLAAHSRLIEDLLTFQAVVADEYTLTNDPEIDSMYLVDTALVKLPVALERLGKLRASGTGVMTKKQILQQQQVDITALLAELNTAVRALRINLEKTSRYNPGMKVALDAATKDMADAAQQVTKVVVEDMFIGSFSMSAADYFAMTTAAIDKGYQQMFETLLPSLEQLIQRRIDKAQRDLRISIGVSILMLLVYMYVAVGVYYGSINSINELARNARTLATGDLSVRVNLGTQDELKLVGDSLNEMTTAFRSLIQRDADQTADIGMVID